MRRGREVRLELISPWRCNGYIILAPITAVKGEPVGMQEHEAKGPAAVLRVAYDRAAQVGASRSQLVLASRPKTEGKELQRTELRMLVTHHP